MGNCIPYFKWRAGRPRWEPGPAIRARGAKGIDLKDANGAWLSFEEAAAAALSINTRLGESREDLEPRDGAKLLRELCGANLLARSPAAIDKVPPGEFLYVFALDGRWAKIGFTTNPKRRLKDLSAAVPMPLSALLVAPGTVAEERALHRHFHGLRLNNEWFRIAGALALWVSEFPTSRMRPTFRVAS